MDDDIRRKMQRAADELTQGDGTDAVTRASRVSAQRRGRMAVATFALVAIAAAGVVRMSTDGDPTGSLITPLASGQPSSGEIAVEPSTTANPNDPAVDTAPEPGEEASPKESPTARPTEEPRPSRAPTPSRCAGPTKPAASPDDVTVTIRTMKRSYAVGEPITIEIAVRNDGLTPIEYDHGAQEFELWATGEHGELWVYSNGLVFTQEMRRSTLAPGETQTRTAVWDQSTCAGPRAAPGAYSLFGYWNAWTRGTKGGWAAQQPTTLEITKA